MCIKSFDSVDKMLHHLNFESHEYEVNTNVSQLSTVSDRWVKRFCVDEPIGNAVRIVDYDLLVSDSVVDMGWAIPKRNVRRFNDTQKQFLNKLFDDGELTKSKVSPEMALKKMKDVFDPKDFLPLTSIKSYFSRRAKKIQEGTENIDDLCNLKEAEETRAEDEEELNVEHANQSEKHDQLRDEITKSILHNVIKRPDLQPDDWIAVNMGSTWYQHNFSPMIQNRRNCKQIFFIELLQIQNGLFGHSSN